MSGRISDYAIDSTRKHFGRHKAHTYGINLSYGLSEKRARALGLTADVVVNVSEVTSRVAIVGMVVANNEFPEVMYKPAQGAKIASAFTVDDYCDWNLNDQPPFAYRPCQSGEGFMTWNNCCAPRSVGYTLVNKDKLSWSYTATWLDGGVGSGSGLCALPVDDAGFIKATWSRPTYQTTEVPGDADLTPHGNYLYWGASIGMKDRLGLNKRYMWTTGLPNLSDGDAQVTITTPAVVDETEQVWRVVPMLYANGLETFVPETTPFPNDFLTPGPWLQNGQSQTVFQVPQTDDIAWQIENSFAQGFDPDVNPVVDFNFETYLVHSGTCSLPVAWRPMKELEYLPKEGSGIMHLAKHMQVIFEQTIGSNGSPAGDLIWIRATTPNLWRNVVAQGLANNSMATYLKAYSCDPRYKGWWRNHYGYEGFIGPDTREKGSLTDKDYWIQSNGVPTDFTFNLASPGEYYKIAVVHFPNPVDAEGVPLNGAPGSPSGLYTLHWHDSAQRYIDNRQTIPQSFPTEHNENWVDVTESIAGAREDYRFTDYDEAVRPPAFSFENVFTDPQFTLQTEQRNLVLGSISKQLLIK